jgi:uncharacterized protein
MNDDWEYHPPVETHLLRSRHVAQTYKIEVMQPARKRGEEARFPVIYATDGNLHFDALKCISWDMQRFPHEAPRYILVGIGYPGDSPVAGSLLRARDLTFPGHPEAKVHPLPIEGVAMAQEGTKDFFGAADFQRFIAEELIPFVDERYETIPGDRTFFGHSGGGGFGLHTLLTRSELFKNYIICSPNVVFSGELPGGPRYEDYDFLLRDARAFIASGKPLNGIRLYMAVGAEEEFDPVFASWQLTSGFYRMAALLKAAKIPGLTLTAEAIPNASHVTVWPTAFIRGMRAAFT